MDGGLVTARIHQGLICTPLDTHRYLVLPGLIGGSPGESGTRTSNPTSIMGHGPGSAPGPRISSRPAQALPPPRGRRVGKDCRREYWERWWALAPPPRRGNGRSGHSTPWRGSRGHRQPRPGSWDGREREGDEGRGREREREIRPGLADPGARRRWSSASWMAWASDVGRWHWTHSAVRG